jgi:cell division protein ZapA (FtsZ GTPase activity inhibitor)
MQNRVKVLEGVICVALNTLLELLELCLELQNRKHLLCKMRTEKRENSQSTALSDKSQDVILMHKWLVLGRHCYQ